ncbi:MAG: radical SAM protein [Bilophila sp.]
MLPEWPLEDVEVGLASATSGDVLRALETAQAGGRLEARDYMALLSPAASPYLEDMARLAREVTRWVGRAASFSCRSANYCTNQCVYCGFNTKNHIHRSMLTMDEVEAEGKAIAATGLRNILLLTGDAPKLTGPDYIAEAARRLRPYFPSIGIEVYSTTKDEYRMLVEAGVDFFTMFQETYNEGLYARLHPAGPKRDFRFRPNAPDRAAAAGMRCVNVGRCSALTSGGATPFIRACTPTGYRGPIPASKRPFPCLGCARMRLVQRHPSRLGTRLCSTFRPCASTCPPPGSPVHARAPLFPRDRLIGLWDYQDFGGCLHGGGRPCPCRKRGRT